MREQFDHQSRQIGQYVEGQARGETVEHAERLISTKVLGKEHEVWDVRTDEDRYWVVTNPTNLYSQEEFKSADYALTFHIGIAVRMMERGRIEIDEAAEEEVDIAWRKYEQAVEAFDSADESEAFQAVGVRCREALIALGRHGGGRRSGSGVGRATQSKQFQGLGRNRLRTIRDRTASFVPKDDF